VDTVVKTGVIVGAIVVVGGLIAALFGGSDDEK